ncbi:hypothetical protein EVAR_55141_1 [Eumeta japonica]|uniref:THAP-type domain-containing protein n=1 Tax=Eumeta variegata TaxID=151549 RepID=A0A4C1YAI3_EUMVA|nr:hypothetical protein EVAR_55141_1 [Eumeta japonica]
MRTVWLELARRDPKSFSTKSDLYLCEDHFNARPDYKRERGRDATKSSSASSRCIAAMRRRPLTGRAARCGAAPTRHLP